MDALAARFVESGGSELVPVSDAMGTGRFFFGIDPQGGAIGFWEAGSHVGAGAFGEDGFMAWNELLSRDIDGSLEFYRALMPWGDQVMKLDPGFDYHVMMLGERPVAGLMAMPDSVPAEVPTHWAVYFEVDDVDATAARANELGGTAMEPFDTPAGRIAIVSDPGGAMFQVIKSQTIEM